MVDKSGGMNIEYGADTSEAEAGSERVNRALKQSQDIAVAFASALERGSYTTDDFGSAMLRAGEAAGLSDAQILRMAESSGFFSESQLSAAAAADLCTQKAQELTQAVANGTMTTDQAGEALRQYAESLGVTAEAEETAGLSALELNQAIEVGQKVFDAMNGILEQTVGQYIDYAMQVKDTSRILGVTTEQSSALLQVCDDLRVSESALTMAFRTALKQGMVPSLETLIDMTAEYQALPDAQSKAQFAMDKFGRSGLEMQKILEQTPETLRDIASSAQDAGLVLSQDMVDGADEARLALDDLEDSITGIKNLISAEWVPGLAKGLQGITALVGGMRTFNQAWQDADVRNMARLLGPLVIFTGQYKDAVADLAYSEGVEREEAIRRAAATKEVTTATEAATIAENYYTDAVDSYSQRSPLYLQQYADFTQAQLDAIAVIENQTNSFSILQMAMSGQLGPELDNFNQKQEELRLKMQAIEDEIATKLLQGYWETGSTIQDLRGDYQDLATQYGDNATAHDEATKRILWDMALQVAMMDGELTTAEMTVLGDMAKNWGLIDDASYNAYLGAVDVMDFLAHDGSVAEAEAMLIRLMTPAERLAYYLDHIDGKTYTADVIVNYLTNGQPLDANGNPVNAVNPENPGGQYGMHGVVPQGFENDTYGVNMSSGEEYYVIPEGGAARRDFLNDLMGGQQSPMTSIVNGGSTRNLVVNINNQVNDNIDIAMMEGMLNNYLGRAFGGV